MCIIVNSMMFICLYGYASIIFAQDTFQLKLTHFLTLVLHCPDAISTLHNFKMPVSMIYRCIHLLKISPVLSLSFAH